MKNYVWVRFNIDLHNKYDAQATAGRLWVSEWVNEWVSEEDEQTNNGKKAHQSMN